jgi:hypothetical protein
MAYYFSQLVPADPSEIQPIEGSDPVQDGQISIQEVSGGVVYYFSGSMAWLSYVFLGIFSIILMAGLIKKWTNF